MGIQLEESLDLTIDFTKLGQVAQIGGLIPAVAQDYCSKDVLIVGYVNKAALDYALKHRVATFWSTSRNEIWIKGQTSGDYLDLIEARVNCEQNTILYLVTLRGLGACHTKTAQGTPRLSCFYRTIKPDNQHLEFTA